MRTTFPAWMAFLLCITTSIKASWQILHDLPDTLANSQSEPSPVQVFPEAVSVSVQENTLPVFVPVYIEQVTNMDTPEKLWFESVIHEDSAQQSICKQSEALQALDKAKEAIGKIMMRQPDFHPELIEARLENLENLKKDWVSESEPVLTYWDQFYKSFGEEEANPWEKGILPDQGGSAIGSLFPSTLPHSLSEAQGEAVGDPSSTWFRAYQSAGQARQSEDDGDDCSAFEQYEEAMNLYQGIWEKYPEFEPELISNRIQLISEKLEQLTGRPGVSESIEMRVERLSD